MNDNKRVRLVQRLIFCFAIAAVEILSDPMGISEGLEIQAQDPGNTNRIIDLMVDELLTDYPVLNESTPDRDSQMLSYQSNQTAIENNTDLQ
jgi:hypothetical protein